MATAPDPLVFASIKNAIEYFKDVGKVEVNKKRDGWGRLAIHVAAGCANDLAEVKRLLCIGADIESKDKLNRTPLYYAAKYNSGDSHFDVIKLLLESGAEVNAQSKSSWTPLHSMTLESNVKAVNLLLDFGADFNIKNNQGETPLSLATMHRTQDLDVIKLLLDRGSDVNHLCKKKYTPLHHACACSNFKLVKLLVKSGANIDTLNSNGRTPLMMVLEGFNACSDWVRYLIKYSDINTIDSSGDNFLCCKEMKESNKIVWEIILSHIAKLQALDFPVHQNLYKTMLNQPKYQEYFKQCAKELKMAKSTKFKNCWVTYFNLQVDNKTKLKNYAGNEDLVQDFYKIDCLIKFPIYGLEIMKKVDKGIETRESFDKSTVELSYCLPIFNPTHLIIKDVLDCLTFKDYNRFISEV